MKRTLCFVVLVSLLLSACSLPSVFFQSKPAEPASSYEPAPVPSGSPAPAPIITPEPVPAATPEPVEIYDAFCEVGTYSDEFNNSWSYVLRIPAIKTSGADATRLNQELFTALYPGVSEVKNAMAMGTSLGVDRVDYTIYINDQLISIVCETDTNWGFESYYVVNFDASTRTEVTQEQLLQRFGLTKEQFLDLGVQVMQQYFQDSLSAAPKDEMYWDRYNKSTAKENFSSDCQLYVDNNGQLCMIVKLYSLAGADYYYHIFTVK